MTSKKLYIEKTAKYVKSVLEGEGTGHDWWHIYRVWNLAKNVASKEKGADILVVELAALLHDIADWKFHNGDETVGPKVAEKWLKSIKVDQAEIVHVCEIIEHISFKGAGVKNKIETLEGKIVQDADRLDALGAIGIARAFAYGGHLGRELYNPKIKPKKHKTFQQYKKGVGPTLNHFYEKLLLLKGKMNTKTAKKMAEDREKYMKDYLVQFYKEWEGKL